MDEIAENTLRELIDRITADRTFATPIRCGFVRSPMNGPGPSEAERLPAVLARERMLATIEEHRARATRYEKRLKMPPSSAYTHQRGTQWRPEQMCRAQWAKLQEIRTTDRERKARKRERDRAVERELQTMLTEPRREKIAA
jgi:hypothetical protein